MDIVKSQDNFLGEVQIEESPGREAVSLAMGGVLLLKPCSFHYSFKWGQCLLFLPTANRWGGSTPNTAFSPTLPSPKTAVLCVSAVIQI